MYTRLTGLSKMGVECSFFRAILVLVCLNLLWRTVRYCLGFPLFGDEAFVANSFLVRDVIGLTEGLEHYQIVPLMYLWGTFLVSAIAGTSEWALRSLSFIAGIIGVLLFVRLAFELLPRKAALLSLAIFCASYYPVRHAAEVKPYSFDLLVSLCITMAVFAYVRSGSDRSLKIWILACTLGVWASYPSVFVSVGSSLVLAVQGLLLHRKYARPAILVAALTTVSFAAMYLWIGSTQRAAGEDVLINLELWASTFPPWSEPSRLAEWFVHTHLGKMFAYPNGGNNGGSSVTFFLFCIGAWTVWQDNRLKVLILVSPFPLMLVAASVEAYPYGGSARVAQHIAPAVCLLAGAGLSRVLRLRPGEVLEKRALIVVAVCVLLMLGGLARDVVKPYKEVADWINRRVVQDLSEAARTGEQWIVFGAWGENAGAVPNLYDWAGSAARFRYYLLRRAEHRVHWGPDEEQLGRLTGGPARLLVYQHPYVPFPAAEFGQYLDRVKQHFEITDTVINTFEEGDEKLSVYGLRARNETRQDQVAGPKSNMQTTP